MGEYGAFQTATGFAVTTGGDDCFSGATGGYSWRDPGFAQTDRHPVTCVNWQDAQAYVSWLSRRTGAAYRLPTGEEWMRAALGSSWPGEHCPWRGTLPVGSCSSNVAGLWDMVGSVFEFTSDCVEGNVSPRVVPRDAIIATSRGWHLEIAWCGRRLVRGDNLDGSGSAMRRVDGNRLDRDGFRVARTLGLGW